MKTRVAEKTRYYYHTFMNNVIIPTNYYRL